jgi:hypothetical protein
MLEGKRACDDHRRDRQDEFEQDGDWRHPKCGTAEQGGDGSRESIAPASSLGAHRVTYAALDLAMAPPRSEAAYARTFDT